MFKGESIMDEVIVELDWEMDLAWEWLEIDILVYDETIGTKDVIAIPVLPYEGD